MADPRPTPEPGPLILLVGHCAADARRLSAMVRAAVAGARVESIGNGRDFEARLAQAALVLINRIPEGWFGGADGLDLVSLASERTVRSMLVSNLEEAQRDAEARGALRGFGKAEMDSQVVRDRLRAAVSA